MYRFTILFCAAMAGFVGNLSPVLLLASPEIPGEAVEQPIAVIGATVHPIAGPAVENATLLIRKGKIASVGLKVKVPEGATTIDAAGKHVYPGLFDAYTDMGLVEVNAVRASVDERETGSINPNVKSWVSVNPDSEIIPVTRSNGVLLALSAPSGGLISGQSAVLQLDGWTWDDLAVRTGVGVHVAWPRMSPSIDWESDQSAKDQMESRDKTLRQLRQAFDDARAYAKARNADPSGHPVDLRWEAMLPVLDREVPLVVDADDIQQIQSAVAFCEQQKVKLILYGGYDAPHCTELLKKHDVAVIVGGVYRLPMRRSEPYDTAFTVPARLHEAGVRFCISGSGRFGASNVRNLPYHAAMAVAFGLPHDEAIRAITSSPAEILGVAEQVGTLERGRDATFIITNGDPLETTTQVEAAYVQGREVDLNNRHKRLWKKYEEKYRRLGLSNE
ncbi:MAG: amidohydrolase family protein [Planctomycetaceae bacterium]|nr:amidohydrolase family protein [Planctomycetales bacterium]MCB9923620.1 amidohydrolase family protein [Planctomycetaceae bacterium]